MAATSMQQDRLSRLSNAVYFGQCLRPIVWRDRPIPTGRLWTILFARLGDCHERPSIEPDRYSRKPFEATCAGYSCRVLRYCARSQRVGKCPEGGRSTLGLPFWPSQIIGLFSIFIWFLLLVSYVLKWIFSRAKAIEELSHPVQCCFVGLIGVSTMLVGALALPYSTLSANLLFWSGACWTVTLRSGAQVLSGQVGASPPLRRQSYTFRRLQVPMSWVSWAQPLAM